MKKLFEEYKKLLNEYFNNFPKKYLYMGTHKKTVNVLKKNGDPLLKPDPNNEEKFINVQKTYEWDIYFNLDTRGEYKSHVHRRLKEPLSGNNFCSINELVDKIKKYIDEFEQPQRPTGTHKLDRNRKNINKVKNKLNNNRQEVIFVLTANKKKIPVIIYMDDENKEVAVSTVLGNNAKGFDRIHRYDGLIWLDEQYEFINYLKLL